MPIHRKDQPGSFKTRNSDAKNTQPSHMKNSENKSKLEFK